MPTVRLGAHDEIRLPEEVKRTLKLRKGAKLDVIVSGSGVFLIPPQRIPADQRYFYTPEWQAKEREADQDFAHGRAKSFADVEDLIRELRGS